MEVLKPLKGPKTTRFIYDAANAQAHEFLCRYMLEYGSVYRIKFIKEIYSINHPDIAKFLLKKVHKEVGKKNFIMDRMEIVFGNGIVASEDDLWLQQRRILMPSFHKKKVSTYIQDIDDVIHETLEDWKKSKHEYFDLTGELRLMVMKLIMKTLLGFDSENYARRILSLMEKGAIIISSSLPFNVPTWVPGNNTIKLIRLTKDLEKLIKELIAANIEAIRQNEAGMLSDLYYATNQNGEPIGEQQMIDEMKSILLAGVFTTSDAMLWAISLLETDSRVKLKLTKDLRETEDRSYLDCVINETMRLYPPVWSMWYGAREDIHIDGATIKKGGAILFNMHAMMRNPAVFKNPDSFSPERFLEEDFPMQSFIPYGYGQRKCIGANLASAIVPKFIELLYTNFDTESALKKPLKAKVNITLTNTQENKIKLRPIDS